MVGSIFFGFPPLFVGQKWASGPRGCVFLLFVWCFAPWPPLGIFNFLYYTYFSRCFGLLHRRPKKKKKRWVSILRYSRRAFNFYDFWFIFTALAVPMSRVTPINVASFPSRTFGPLHWIFPRALLMLFYAAPCVFCCVFNEMFIALFFYSKPPTPIDWMKRSFRIRSTRFSRLFRFSRSSVLFIVDVVSNVATCSCVKESRLGQVW